MAEKTGQLQLNVEGDWIDYEVFVRSRAYRENARTPKELENKVIKYFADVCFAASTAGLLSSAAAPNSLAVAGTSVGCAISVAMRMRLAYSTFKSNTYNNGRKFSLGNIVKDWRAL